MNELFNEIRQSALEEIRKAQLRIDVADLLRDELQTLNEGIAHEVAIAEERLIMASLAICDLNRYQRCQ